jgi:hypothetical protein
VKGSRNNSVVRLFDVSVKWRNIKQTYNLYISTTLHLTDTSNRPTTELFLLPFTWLKHQTDLQLNYFYYPSLDWYIKQTYNWIISTTLHLTETSNRPTTELFLLPFTWLIYQTNLQLNYFYYPSQVKGSRNNSVVGLFDISVKWRVVEIIQL